VEIIEMDLFYELVVTLIFYIKVSICDFAYIIRALKVLIS